VAKLFAREVSPDLHSLLFPHDPGLPSQKQANQLQAHGFVPLYDVARGEQLERLGALIASTRCDGALWPMARAARKDGLARWALEADLRLLDALIQALTAGGQALPRGAKGSDALSKVIDMVEERLGKVDGLDRDALEALETVVRLGSPDAVLAYLASL
jgi:hypothetical protein